MHIAEPTPNFKIRDSITRLQLELETALKEVFIQAGQKIQPEKREEVEQGMTKSMQLLEQLKTKYYL